MNKLRTYNTYMDSEDVLFNVKTVVDAIDNEDISFPEGLDILCDNLKSPTGVVLALMNAVSKTVEYEQQINERK